MDAVRSQRAKLAFVVLVDGSTHHLSESLSCMLSQAVPEIEVACLCATSAEGLLGCSKEFALRDSRVSVISYGGVSIAAGIREALGRISAPLVMVTRGDDVVDTGLAERLLGKAQSWGDVCDVVLCDADHVWRGTQGLRRELVPAADDGQAYGRLLAANEAVKALSAFCVPCSTIWRTEYLKAICGDDKGLCHYDSLWFNAVLSARRITFEKSIGYGSSRADGVSCGAAAAVASLGADFGTLCERYVRSDQGEFCVAASRMLYGCSLGLIASSKPLDRREAVACLRTGLQELQSLELQSGAVGMALPLGGAMLMDDPERYYYELWGSYDQIDELKTKLNDALLALEACRESVGQAGKTEKAPSKTSSLTKRLARKCRSALRSLKRRIG